MLKKLYPYEYIESVFLIDYQKLYDDGYRGIFFDIDNTLVDHGADSNERVDRLLRYIQSIGFKTLMLSDNSEERILRFLKNIESPYIAEAGKPNPSSYEKAIEMLGLSKKEVIMIGDQIFTDIYGANRCGIASILVRFRRRPEETNFGKRRAVEKWILKHYRKNRSCTHRLGDIYRKDYQKPKKKKKLFCEINPLCYAISEQKEIAKRYAKDFLGHDKFAKDRQESPLPNVVYTHENYMIKRGPGIDPVLQNNKAQNIRLAAATMNGLVIHPGETYSFWKCVGKLTKKKGYSDGRVLQNGILKAGIGGGLCNLANTIHILVLHSPLTVTEFHNHSDALAPDHEKRVPFSAGTSVSFNQIDYRFRNDTDQDIQLLVWCEGDYLKAELRSECEFPWTYDISEENHHFAKEGKKYYRISQIYKNTYEKENGNHISKELVLDNHSEVMFDYDLIPKEQIWSLEEQVVVC